MSTELKGWTNYFVKDGISRQNICFRVHIFHQQVIYGL